MTKRQPGRIAPSHPLWMPWMATLCLLLVAAVGTAQAVHVHGEWLPKSESHASLPATAAQGQGEEHCPLCVAMHTAMPATLHVVPEPVAQSARLLTAQALVAKQRYFSFAMFSRPPPVAVRTLASNLASNDVPADVAVAA